DRPIAARSPWQNGCAERIRRDCLDHVVVFGERHLHHLLKMYQEYYNVVRTHLGTSKNSGYSSAAPEMPTNDSLAFPFRFIAVHAGMLRDRHREQFSEVPIYHWRGSRRSRSAQAIGQTSAVPVLGGLHHQYVRTYVSHRDKARLRNARLEAALPP